MMHRPLPRNRYGVEIKLPTVHAECECLREVLTLLEGQSGVVRVFDRHSLELVVDGAINDVWASLDGMADSVDVRMEPAAELESSEMVPVRSKARGNGLAGSDRQSRVEMSGALDIASAYYFGDLGGVVRRHDGDGPDTFFRPGITRVRIKDGV